MQKRINLKFGQPVLANGETHVSTTILIADTPEQLSPPYTGATTINLTNNILSHSFIHNFVGKNSIYSKVIFKIKLSDGTTTEIDLGIDMITPYTKTFDSSISVYPPVVIISKAEINDNLIDDSLLTITPPRFHNGTANWDHTTINVYDIYNNLIHSFDVEANILEIPIRLHNLSSYDSIFISAKYHFNVDVFQPESRTYLALDRSREGRFTISKQHIDTDTATNNIIIKYSYSIIKKVSWALKNPRTGEILEANSSSGITIVLQECSKYKIYESLMLGVYIETSEFGYQYKEFIIRIV